MKSTLKKRMVYECGRCARRGLSQPLPTDPEALAIYGLPEGWVLVSTPLGQDDYGLCVACQRRQRAAEREAVERRSVDE